MKSRVPFIIGVLCFMGLVLFATLNRHSRAGYFNYQSELWADKAGYYVYLPATFKFSFNPANFPDSVDAKTGGGFVLDKENGKVLTKYTCGVAILQAPFFLAAEALVKPLGYEDNGFSPIHHSSVNIASLFYLFLGLFFLFKFLRARVDRRSALLTVLSVFLATHLYYYAIDETGMSHVYSFALFCLFLHAMQATSYMHKPVFWQSLLLGCLMGMIVLIRPTNALFLSAYFFLDAGGQSAILARLKRLLKFSTLGGLVLGVSIVALPQLLYWYYASGSIINYSYGSEGFNWLSPKPFHVWFSPNNGLFLYTPSYLLIVVLLFSMIKRRIENGLYLLMLLLAITYVFSSWWFWSFGCAFGARSYVEYLAIFSIPVAYGFVQLRRQNRLKKLGFAALVIALVVFNLKLAYSHNGCFYGDHAWDWAWYLKLLMSPVR